MGWAYGVNQEGREVGYGVGATCDTAGCDAEIDRGLAYVCGGMHDGDEHGCGRYFCGEHLSYWFKLADPADDESEERMSQQLCDECGQRWESGEGDE